MKVQCLFLSTSKRREVLLALAGVAQWIECQPVNQMVAGSIPCQGTCLGCGPGPPVGGVQEATVH